MILIKLTSSLSFVEISTICQMRLKIDSKQLKYFMIKLMTLMMKRKRNIENLSLNMKNFMQRYMLNALHFLKETLVQLVQI